MNTGKEVEVVKGDLLDLDAKLVVELALGSALSTRDGVNEVGASLAGDAERVRAAGVGPHVGERNLLGGSLLEEELVLVVEEEDGKGAVKEALVDVGHQVAWRILVSYTFCNF